LPGNPLARHKCAFGLSECSLQDLSLFLLFAAASSAQRTAHKPPRGLRSATKLDLKLNKSENDLKRKLDNVVGFMGLLGGHSHEIWSLSMKLSYSTSPPSRVPEP